MNDDDYDSGVPLGTAGLQKLLSLSRSSMESERSCERFYDLSRRITMSLIRSGREERELELWKSFCGAMGGLALGLRDEYASPKYSYLLQAAYRFETLHDLLHDQIYWRSVYELPQVLELPFVRDTLLFLSNKNNITLSAYLEGLEIRHTTVVFILAELRLLMWKEDEAGIVCISLTESGTQLALNLLVSE